MKSREQIAYEMGIPFHSIDPGSEEERRVNESADARDADAKREGFWMKRIAESGGIKINTLMICGYGHTESFTALIQSAGYGAQNLGRGD